MVNTFNAREKCPQCIANPLPKSNRPINAKAHRYWSVVYDKEHDENIRLRKGAKFTEYDIDEMERQGVIAPGSMFRHTKTRKYRVIKERR